MTKSRALIDLNDLIFNIGIRDHLPETSEKVQIIVIRMRTDNCILIEGIIIIKSSPRRYKLKTVTLKVAYVK